MHFHDSFQSETNQSFPSSVSPALKYSYRVARYSDAESSVSNQIFLQRVFGFLTPFEPAILKSVFDTLSWYFIPEPAQAYGV